LDGRFDHFARLQGDAVLSDWKPHATPETDIPDIPNFLRRTDEQRRAGWDHFDRWRAAHPTAPLSAYRRSPQPNAAADVSLISPKGVAEMVD
jgi:hypothetical protein